MAGHEPPAKVTVDDGIVHAARRSRAGERADGFDVRPARDDVRYTHLGENVVENADAVGFIRDDDRREWDSALSKILLCSGVGACWSVMGVYALAGAVSILILTLASIATFNRLEHRFERWTDRLPRVSAAVLGIMGVLYLFGLV